MTGGWGRRRIYDRGWGRKRRDGRGHKRTYLVEITRLHHLIISDTLVVLPKQDVVSNTSGEDPRRLRRVTHLSF